MVALNAEPSLEKPQEFVASPAPMNSEPLVNKATAETQTEEAAPVSPIALIFSIASTATNTATSLASTATSTAGQLASQATSTASSLATSATATASHIATSATTTASNLATTTKDSVNHCKLVATNKVANAVNDITFKVNAVTDTVTAKAFDGYQRAKELTPEPVVNGVNVAMGTVVSAKDGAYGSYEKTRELIGTKVSQTKVLVQPYVEQTVGIATATKDRVTETVVNVKMGVQERVTMAAQGVQQTVSNVKTGISDRVYATVDYTKETGARVLETAQHYVPEPVYRGLVTGVQMGKNGVEMAVEMKDGVHRRVQGGVDTVRTDIGKIWSWSKQSVGLSKAH